MKKNELNYKDLKDVCNPNILILKQLLNLIHQISFMGQDRGIKL